MQKGQEPKPKPCKSNKNLNSSSSLKTIPQKLKHKSKQKSISRKKKKTCNDSFEDDPHDFQDRHHQYYNKEKREKRQKNTLDPHNFSEYISVNTMLSSGRINDKQEGGNSSKLNLDKIKGVITFQGKYLKNNIDFNSGKNPANWEYSSENFTEVASRQETRKSNKNKSKSKNKSKNFHDSRTKGKLKLSVKDQKQKNSNSRKVQKRQTPCAQIEATEQTTKNTPQQTFSNYERNEEVDLENIKTEMADDKNKLLKLNMLKKVPFEKRAQCISLISRICGELHFKKDVFSLSMQLFDSYLNDQVMISKHKVFSLACLLLALKLEEAETANIFYVQLSVHSKSAENDKEKKTEERVKISKSLGKEKQKQKRSKKDKQLSRQKDREKEKKSKEEVIFQKYKILRAILKEEIDQTVSKAEIFQFETMILLKQNFRVWKRTFSYWIDTLTTLWDRYILEDCLDNYGAFDCLLFRCLTKTRNFSYLVQILEASLYTTQFYSYNLVTIVLSAMYLLVRINMEGDDEGFEYYRVNLQKSSNVLFVDMAGVNVIFGEFLGKIGVEMGEILPCCQFLCIYLNQNILIDFDYEQIAVEKFDHALSVHFHNLKLFPF